MLLAVSGKPIAHSLSPDLHRAGLQFAHVNGASFRLIADTAEEIISVARKIGIRGCNITAPFKEELCRYLNSISPEAKQLGAVNTLVFEHDQIRGYNTDVYGVEKSLEELIGGSALLQQLRELPYGALVLGAGGAAKAVCHTLNKLNINFVILNRTLERAQSLASRFGAAAYSFEDSEHEKIISAAKLLINCLATDSVPFDLSLLNAEQMLLDSHYKAPSQIAKKITQLNAKVKDGFDWLLYQSQKSQEMFLGKLVENSQLKLALESARNIKNLKSVALIGLMGTGKTEAGKILAQKLNLKFLDLDSEIEKKTGKKVAEIFELSGEQEFRKIEAQVLNAILSNAEAIVLSCGGGVVTNPGNSALLQQYCKLCWLWTSTEILAKRLAQDQQRPLLQGRNTFERLNELLTERKMLYAQIADFVIDTDVRTAQQVGVRIYEEIC